MNVHRMITQMITRTVASLAVVSALWGTGACAQTNAPASSSSSASNTPTADSNTPEAETATSNSAASETSETVAAAPNPESVTPAEPFLSGTSTAAPTTQAAAIPFQQQTLLTDLEHPWSMAWLPDGTLLITERPGELRVVREGVLDPTPVAGLPEIFVQGQGGLLDITVHPEFETQPWVYLSYSSGNGRANHTRVIRGRWQPGQGAGEGDRLLNPEVIFEVSQLKPDAQHFGSRFAWLPDQTLLIAIGDGGNPPVRLDGDLIRLQAQNLDSHLGKVVRINDDGSIPADNPFVNDAGADPAVWSYGHRNIQGLAYDPESDRVWVSEHGARGGDEINLVEPRQNYGWPLVTHSQEYFGGEISPHRSLPGMVDPRVVWTPAVAPSGLAIYQGDQFPAWQGHLFAGGLVSRDIQRFELDAAGNVVDQQFIPIGQRVRDIRQGPDGLLYVLTDENRGQLIRLEPQ